MPQLPPPLCPRCHDLGWLSAGPGADIVRCACRAEADRAEAARRALVASNLTPRLLRQTFACFERARAADAYDALAAFAAAPAGWLTLVGRRGTGKTHLLAATAGALLATGRSPLFVVVPDFLAYLRSGVGAARGVGDVEARVQQAIAADVLLLDDLGAESGTGWAEEQLFRIINGRYNNEAPLVVATNVVPERLEERIGSRLEDAALGRVIVLGGDDYRKLPPEQRQEQRQQLRPEQRQQLRRAARSETGNEGITHGR